MAEKITGTCNCGRHTYTVPRPDKMNLCHCIDCKKWAGAQHSAHMFVKTADIDTHGSPEPKKHLMKGDSGNRLERVWCDECGCGIWMRNLDKSPDTTFMKAGLFKHGEIPQPHMENWLRNKEEWEVPAKGTTRQSDVN